MPLVRDIKDDQQDGAGLDAQKTGADDRLLRETGTAARVAALAAPALADIGYRLVRVKIGSMNGCTVQIMAERDDGMMTIDDCVTASHLLSPLLDVADPIGGEYHLEMSSPGIDRPLVRRTDFERYQGHEVKIKLHESVDGHRRLRGLLGALADSHVAVITSVAGQHEQQLVPLDAIDTVKLVLTDALIAISEKPVAAEKSSVIDNDVENHQP